MALSVSICLSARKGAWMDGWHDKVIGVVLEGTEKEPCLVIVVVIAVIVVSIATVNANANACSVAQCIESKKQDGEIPKEKSFIAASAPYMSQCQCALQRAPTLPPQPSTPSPPATHPRAPTSS